MKQNNPNKLNKRSVTEEYSVEAFACSCSTCSGSCGGDSTAFANMSYSIHVWPNMNK
jgi:putative bacteriocin precursor